MAPARGLTLVVIIDVALWVVAVAVVFEPLPPVVVLLEELVPSAMARVAEGATANRRSDDAGTGEHLGAMPRNSPVGRHSKISGVPA